MTKRKEGRIKVDRRARQASDQKSHAPGIHGFRAAANRADAEYDPLRDGELHYSDLTAFICRDPLPGRSALDRKRSEPGIRSISLAGGGL